MKEEALTLLHKSNVLDAKERISKIEIDEQCLVFYCSSMIRTEMVKFD